MGGKREGINPTQRRGEVKKAVRQKFRSGVAVKTAVGRKKQAKPQSVVEVSCRAVIAA